MRFDQLGADVTHADVETMLLDAGWERCGTGDWAVALRAPDGDVVARISPFDPVGPYTARLYREASATDLVPKLHAHGRLAGGGDLQVMERLDAVERAEAVEFLQRLTEPAPELAALAAVVNRVHAVAERELPWCGPLDGNPSNVMRRGRGGGLVLTDPFYADGPALYATAEKQPERLVALIPEAERRFMTDIPLAESGPWSDDDRDELRRRIARADEP